jgi:hypothetical protein
MSNIFELQKGKLEFRSDQIFITDNAQRQKRVRLLTSGIWIIYGILSILRYMRTGDEFLLWTGLLIGIGHFVVFIAFLFRSVKSEITMDEVKSMKFKSRFNNDFLDIKLSSGRVRRVSQVDDTAELKEYLDRISAK